ncbi:MAG TPA: hypothetical protein VFD97_04450 [Acidimicrobiia bacterium]|nr:hypothetical protein [Acidimicrobiia bacterium]
MKQWFISLPGPMGIKVVVAVIVLIVGLVALFFFYDWIGTNLLDSGGTIG